MASDGIQVLKDAFDKGFNSFQVYPNTDNPYPKDSLPYKEFIRGWNRGYWENSKKAAV